MEFSYIIIKCVARYVPCDLTMKRWHIIGIDMGGKYEALLTNYVIIFHLFGLIIRFCCSVVRLPARLFVYSSSLSLRLVFIHIHTYSIFNLGFQHFNGCWNCNWCAITGYLCLVLVSYHLLLFGPDFEISFKASYLSYVASYFIRKAGLGEWIRCGRKWRHTKSEFYRKQEPQQ